jgi:uracil-DNA glycosylase family 4
VGTSSERLIQVIQSEIVQCERCPRLRQHCVNIGIVRRRAYRDEVYWSRPVPSFGDPAAEVLIVGLAPGAHGANRTGRMFTGDSSGDFLYRVLWKTGYANQPEARRADDGLMLTGAYITASAHCAPPDNKPAREEIAACRPYLLRELEALRNVKVVVALGRIAFDNYLDALRSRNLISRKSGFVFGHGEQNATYAGGPVLLASYHPSQQNTSTGKLTEAMLLDIFWTARQICSADVPSSTSSRPEAPQPAQPWRKRAAVSGRTSSSS